MNAWPDAPVVQAFLARAWKRLAVIAAIDGVTIGFAAAIVWVVVSWLAGWRPGVAIGGTILLLAGALAASVRRVRRTEIAGRVERRAPECRNLLITTAELLDHPGRVPASMGAVVCGDTSRVIARLDVPTLFPLGRSLGICALAAALWIAVAVGVAAHPAPRLTASGAAGRAATVATITGIRVDVVPPEYAAQPTTSLQDPARVPALAGSRVRVTIKADAASVMLETVTGRTALTRDDTGAFTGEIQADADGYLAVQPTAADGHEGARRLIGLDVVPDRPPVVRITKPGHDLFLSNAQQHLTIALDAQDDLGLASLRLTYTKVGGSGENLQFSEGELPLRVSQGTDRAWTAEGDLALGAFGLIPGDMLVYRGVATDRRPGRTPVESDAFIISMVSPGEVAAEGFAVDDERDRYALSEQMVILKTERLSARRPSLSAEAFADEALNIAAEQRQVRAEFIFMMGGELGEDAVAISGTDLDETTEAMGEADLLAGRAQNQGRRDLLIATRSMSEAAVVLTTPDLVAALKSERAALAALQRAFSKNRYLLRTLSKRDSLDLSRRLTGKFTDVARDARPAIEAPADVRMAALRHALAGVAALGGRPAAGGEWMSEVTTLAQDVLRIDPGSEPLRQVSARLSDAATAVTEGHPNDVAALLDRAATDLAGAIRTGLENAPQPALTPDAARLNGALADAIAAKKGRQ